MQKQKISLIIGVALALAAVLMINAYLGQERQAAIEAAKAKVEQAKANQTTVLVAKKDIPQGVLIEPANLEINIVPNQFVQPQAVTSLERIAGMMSTAAISKGEQLTLTKLAYPKQRARGLAELTPVGKRAVTITADNIASLAGMLKAGDYVDVNALVNVPVQTPEGKQVSQAAVIPLFQNVLVLAIGQEMGIPSKEEPGRAKTEKKEVSSGLITLALAPQEASMIAFVQEQGKLRLVLRSPADSQIQLVQPANWETLFQYVMPKQAKSEPKEAPPQPAETGPSVEIYRGMNKEKIPLSK